ncbi:hypothetical protein NC651_008398 [Populus alba x Populus x berolinensis]|nr:hypothetical protein NC651_008398 [Populus alba x Populus x berolinensis]
MEDIEATTSIPQGTEFTCISHGEWNSYGQDGGGGHWNTLLASEDDERERERERELEGLIIGDCLERARGTTLSLTRGDTHNHHPTTCRPSSSPPSKQKHHFPSFLEHCMDEVISFRDLFQFAKWIVLGLLSVFLLI